MTAEPTVFVVDDDEGVRRWLRDVIKSAGLNVETYASAEEFLDHIDATRPGCVVLDLSMQGMSGLELQAELSARGIPIPVIIATGYGDVPTVVRAMKADAVDFVQKPISGAHMLELIRMAIQRDADAQLKRARRNEVLGRLRTLSPREREVMQLVVVGTANKQIANQLGLSEKTVEMHRAHVMKKLGARSVAELVRTSLLAETTSNPQHDSVD